MNPQRMFPLLVILSRDQVREVARRGVRQAQSQGFQVAEGSLVEVEPVLPGCSCFPPREQLRVGPGEVSATFWVVPEVLGQVMHARVVVRQEGHTLAEVPLQMHVVKQSMTRLLGALSLVLPFLLLVLKHFGLDFESQSEEGFALYARIARLVVQHLTPEVLTGLLLAATVALYLWLRPRQREVFWDIQTAQPAPPPRPAVPVVSAQSAADLYQKAKQAFARGDERDGERLLGELLSAQPLHAHALLCLAGRRARAGDHAAALPLFERSLATGRCQAVHYFRAALSAGQSGDLRRALNILRRAEAELPG